MTGDRTSADKFDELRRQAEKFLRDRPDAAPEQPTTALDLINELQIHQVELDIQNEELKQAQGELSALYREYEALYEFAPCGYVTLNEEGIITRANLTAVRLLETERKRLMGDSFSRRISLEREYIFLDALNQAGLTGEKQTVEPRLNREDAAAQWVRLDIEADRDETGWTKQWRMAMTDITAQKQADEKLKRSEERYRRIVETAEEGIWLLDRKWETEFVNAQMAEMLGYPSDEMIGRHLLSFMDEQEQSRARELMARREQGVNEKHDFKFQRRDGADLWAIVSTNAIISDDGQFKHALAMVTDITERKRVEEELKASERKFRNIADNVPGLVLQYKLNPDGGDELLYISKGVEHLFEISQEAAIQNIGLLWNRIFKGDLDEYVASIKASSEALSFWEREFRIEMPDGGIKWVHACGVPAGQEDGSVVWDSLAIDITKQKESENALQKSLAFNKAIIDSSKDCIKTLDLCGNLLFMNKGGQRLLEIENIEPYLNQSWIAFWKGDDCLEIEKAVQSAKEGTIGAFEGYCPTAKGTPKWWDILFLPIMDDKGVVHQLLSVSRDITDRKRAEQELIESEARYRRLLNTLEEGYLKTDLQGHIVTANAASAKLFGYASPEDMHGEHMNRLWANPDDRISVIEKMKKKGFLANFEMAALTKNGRRFWMLCNARLIMDENGEIAGTEALVRDITELKQAEAALQKSLAEKEVLLREIHHRVKNNMQAISSVLRMHARRVDNAQLTKIFNDCQNRIGAMSLIHEALYQSENLAKIDFQTYLKKLCRNLAQGHDAPRRRIDLTTSAADVSLNMDQGVAVGMIIAELISNAFKHAFPDDKGGAVSVHMDRPDGEAVRLVVSDTGIGLPEDFDIQNPSSLGMRLVSGAVTRELGGTIDVESDNGARFIIRFKQRPTRF